jgi:hypothetical protein
MTDNITLRRAVVEQVRKALEAMQSYAAAERKGLRICDEAVITITAALAEPEHIHTCGPDCQKPLCVNRRREVAAAGEAEREACAKVCDDLMLAHPGRADLTADQCAQAIRARGCQK